MNRWLCRTGMFGLLSLVASPAFSAPSGCALPETSGARELQQVLSLRAVEVVRLAASSDRRLADLVAPSASFKLGAGDVGRPLGSGVSGARMLAQTMHADSYRFLGWDYMDMPQAACAKQTVEVEFIDSQGSRLSRVTFTFDAGRVVSADGWERSFETGRL